MWISSSESFCHRSIIPPCETTTYQNISGETLNFLHIHIFFISFVFNFSFQDHEIVGYQYGVRNMDARSNGSIKPTKTELFSQKMAAGLL